MNTPPRLPVSGVDFGGKPGSDGVRVVPVGSRKVKKLQYRTPFDFSGSLP